MRYLIINELKKMISKKRFIIVFVIITITTLISSYASYKNTTSSKLPLYTDVKSTLVQISEANDRRNMALAINRMSANVENEALLQNLNSQVTILEEERDLLNNLGGLNLDWRNILKQDINLILKKKELAEKEGKMNVIEDINKELSYKSYHLDNNIRYELSPNANAFYNLPSIIYYSQRLFLLVIISILVSDIISGENESSTIKVLLTKPVSRGKILLSKLLTCIIAGNGIIIGLQLAVFLIFGVFFTFGNPNIPFIVGTKYNLDYNMLMQSKRAISAVVGSSYVIPAWQMILELLVLQILLITASISLCFLLSTIFKSNIASTGIGFFVLIISWLVTFNATDTFRQMSGRPTFIQKIIPYSFSTYYDSFAVLTGKLSENLLNPIATKNTFILVSIIWIVSCYVISHLIFTRRDML